MDQQASTVSAIIRALDGKEALVEVEAGGCGRCHEKGGCGGQQLTQMFCASPKTYRVNNNLGLGIGDRVTLAIAAGSVRRTANLAYGVPLTATIIGAALGTLLAGDFGGLFDWVIILDHGKLVASRSTDSVLATGVSLEVFFKETVRALAN